MFIIIIHQLKKDLMQMHLKKKKKDGAVDFQLILKRLILRIMNILLIYCIKLILNKRFVILGKTELKFNSFFQLLKKNFIYYISIKHITL